MTKKDHEDRAEELDDEEYDDEEFDDEDELDDDELDDEERDDEFEDDDEYADDELDDDYYDDDDDEFDDDEYDDDDEYSEEEYRREKEELREKSEPGRSSRSTQITVIVVVTLIAIGYASNCWLNSRTSAEVLQLCQAEDERLSNQINKAINDEMPAMDWMVSLYRARRRYSQEICGGTLEQLTWWHWNLTRRIDVDISQRTQTDITRVLTRAGSSCEHEIQIFEKVLKRELTARKSPPVVKKRAADMVRGQLASCQELQKAIRQATPGFWPPLRASSPGDVPVRLKELMPRAVPTSEASTSPSDN